MYSCHCTFQSLQIVACLESGRRKLGERQGDSCFNIGFGFMGFVFLNLSPLPYDRSNHVSLIFLSFQIHCHSNCFALLKAVIKTLRCFPLGKKMARWSQCKECICISLTFQRALFSKNSKFRGSGSAKESIVQLLPNLVPVQRPLAISLARSICKFALGFSYQMTMRREAISLHCVQCARFEHTVAGQLLSHIS